MSLLALLFALFCERGLTHLLHLREWRWLDPYFDWADRAVAGRAGPVVGVVTLLLIALPVVPVFLIARWLEPQLLGLPGFAFAVVVLLFAFGPRDLKDEVDDYAAALERRDRDEILRRGKALLESSPSAHGRGTRVAVEEAIFIQANNRIFGVIFWFMVLGAGGAWLFRVSDMLRRRAAFEAARQGMPRLRGDLGTVLSVCHGLLAWLPARLTALTYAMAGSFEDAVGNWRSVVVGIGPIAGVLDRAEDLLARVGKGSLQPSLAGVPPERLDVATACGAWRLVRRGLWIWIAAIALLVSTGAAAATDPIAPGNRPRLISLAPNLTEIAFAAGAGSLLVGTVEFSDFPAAAKALPRVGDAWRVDAERVLALRPDVVLVWPTGTPDATISRLRKLGLNIVEVPTQTLADVPRALRQVGQLSGTGTVAERAAREFEARVAQQRARYSQRTSLTVFIQIDDEPIYTVNGRHVISEIVTLCGGRNVFADLPQLAPPISAEAVLAADPQVILSTDDTIADPLAQWKSWPRMKAVSSGHVFKLSSDLVTRASPRLAEGVEVTCSALERARARPAQVR